tara:strand:- start:623 stop:829 length:207 start_codon:yes stop_codon:yes gene_type:complete
MSDPRVVKALETIQPVLDQQGESVIKDICRLIADNELTPDLALNKCHELNAIHTLPKKVLRGGNRPRG